MIALLLPDLNGMELIAALRWQGSSVPMLVVADFPLEEEIFRQQEADAVMAEPLIIAARLAWLRQGQRADAPRMRFCLWRKG